MSGIDQPSGPEIYYKQTTTYEIIVDGESIAAYRGLGPIIEASEVPERTREALLEHAIQVQKEERAQRRDQDVVVLGVFSTVAALGMIKMGDEGFHSHSNWIKAAWAAGSLACGVFALGGLSGIGEVIKNRAYVTRKPTERIRALEEQKQQLSA